MNQIPFPQILNIYQWKLIGKNIFALRKKEFWPNGNFAHSTEFLESERTLLTRLYLYLKVCITCWQKPYTLHGMIYLNFYFFSAFSALENVPLVKRNFFLSVFAFNDVLGSVFWQDTLFI